MGSFSLGQPWGLAFRNLTQDALRLALSVVGIALALMLILFLLSLRAGIFRSAVVYLDNAPGSIAVMPQGTRSTGAGSGQFLSAETVDAIAATPGVARSTPILLMMVVPELHGEKEVVRLVGYEPALGGGPWSLSSGREPDTDSEIVMDRVFADRHGFQIGDTFGAGGRELQIVGISNETASWTGSYVFARKTLVESLALAPGAASIVLVTPAPGTSSDAVMTTLESLPGTNVLRKSQVMANDQQLIAGIADQIIIVMVAAAFIVGALVVAMVIYAATTERRGEYGIVKALGARNNVLYRVVALQALVAAGLGAGLGIGFAFVMGRLVVALKPQFMVSIEPSAIVLTFGAGLVMALLGALFPARAIASMAPAEVFQR